MMGQGWNGYYSDGDDVWAAAHKDHSKDPPPPDGRNHDPGAPYGGGFKPREEDGPSYTPNSEGGTWYADRPTHMDYGASKVPGAGPSRIVAGTGGGSTFRSMPQFGGAYGQSNIIADQYGQQAQDYANRRIGFDQSQPYRIQQADVRGAQWDAYNMQRAAAMGQVPSAAVIGQSAGLNRGLESQIGAMRAAGGSHATPSRGGYGSALGAMRSGADLGMNVLGESARGRQGEVNSANEAWMKQGSGIRSADQSAFNIDQARELQQAEMNQRMQLGSQGMANQIMLDQLGADTGVYGNRLGYQTQSDLAAANRAYQTTNELISGGLGAGSGLVNSYLGSRSNDSKGGSGPDLSNISVDDGGNKWSDS